MCNFRMAMDVCDSIGRKRQPGQNRGLRPLFPKLPTSFESRAVRIAMTTSAWNRIDGLIAESATETRPRALGEVIEVLLARFDTSLATRGAVPIYSRELSEPCVAESEQFSGADWQKWQIQKERALLPAHTH
jgi:hypothetical protein